VEKKPRVNIAHLENFQIDNVISLSNINLDRNSGGNNFSTFNPVVARKVLPLATLLLTRYLDKAEQYQVEQYAIYWQDS